MAQTKVKPSNTSFDRVRVYHSSNQSVNTSTDTILSFDSETYDSNGLHSTTVNPSRITVAKTGYYHISFLAVFNTNATGTRSAAIKKNGSFLPSDLAISAAPDRSTGIAYTDTVYLTAGDYIELNVWQNSGGALTITGSSTFLLVQQVG